MLQYLIDVFSLLQNQKKKKRGTHTQEIQDSQHYFEIVYNPCDLRRTIYDTNLSLKYKVT